MTQISIRTPVALIAAANQLALCIGYSEADGKTFTVANTKDADANEYATAHGPVQDEFVTDAMLPLVEPPWGADMELAGIAQAAVVIINEGDPVPPDAIAVVIDYTPDAALATLGLVKI